MKNKPLSEVKAEFVYQVVLYLKDVCHVESENLPDFTAHYVDDQWPIVESCYKYGDLCNTGSATDFTCDFVCRAIARGDFLNRLED